MGLHTVVPGRVPGTPIWDARPCIPKRDGRDKPGHDKREAVLDGTDS